SSSKSSIDYHRSDFGPSKPSSRTGTTISSCGVRNAAPANVPSHRKSPRSGISARHRPWGDGGLASPLPRPGNDPDQCPGGPGGDRSNDPGNVREREVPSGLGG